MDPTQTHPLFDARGHDRILLIGEAPATGFPDRLRSLGLGLVTVPGVEQAQHEASEWTPAAILLAPTADDPLGLVRWARSQSRLAFVPVVLLASAEQRPSPAEALHAGADDVLSGSLDAAEMASSVAARIGRARSLERLALRDPVTELLNLRFMNDRLPAEVGRAVRAKTGLCLALIELDEFKRVIDEEGHSAGDRLLASFSRALGAGLRSYDIGCRLGGNEFAVLFPDCSAAGAQAALGQVRNQRRWVLSGLRPITFSAGLAEFPGDGGSIDELLEVADKNLRRARRLGCDCIVVTPRVEHRR